MDKLEHQMIYRLSFKKTSLKKLQSMNSRSRSYRQVGQSAHCSESDGGQHGVAVLDHKLLQRIGNCQEQLCHSIPAGLADLTKLKSMSHEDCCSNKHISSKELRQQCTLTGK